MWPAPGAGICWTLITEPAALLPRVALARTWTSRRAGKGDSLDEGMENGDTLTGRSIRGGILLNLCEREL